MCLLDKILSILLFIWPSILPAYIQKWFYVVFDTFMYLHLYRYCYDYDHISQTLFPVITIVSSDVREVKINGYFRETNLVLTKLLSYIWKRSWRSVFAFSFIKLVWMIILSLLQSSLFGFVYSNVHTIHIQVEKEKSRQEKFLPIVCVFLMKYYRFFYSFDRNLSRKENKGGMVISYLL